MFHFHRKTNIYLFSGPSLPTTCRFPTMVPNLDGHGVILLGCYETQDTLYELKNVDGNIKFSILKHYKSFNN